MSVSIAGKVAAITGAASGIGLECARVLIEEGAKVVLIDRAEDRLADCCKELGANALALTVDLLKPAEVSAMLPTLMPARRAASRLPPTAFIERPQRVRVSA